MDHHEYISTEWVNMTFMSPWQTHLGVFGDQQAYDVDVALGRCMCQCGHAVVAGHVDVRVKL